MKAGGKSGQVQVEVAPGERAQDAIPRLLEAHGGRLLGMASRLCGQRDEAEDIVQETFLQAFRKWDQFEGRSDPATWLYTIAVRACQRKHRRRSGEPRNMESLSGEADEGAKLKAEADSGPLEALLRREAEEKLEKALTCVPLTFRTPLVLKDVAEFSIKEVAQVLGLKPATVKTRVHRGRLALKAALERGPGAPACEEMQNHENHEVCLNLLQSRMEALDRGVPFPLPPDELCSRCRTLFSALKMNQDACHSLGQAELPGSLRQMVMKRIQEAG